MKDKDRGEYAQPQRILEAALETIAQHKISGSRMRQIAANAGMSQGNLHYYFPSKSELFLALLDNMLESFVQDRANVLVNGQLSPKKKLRFFFEQMKDILHGQKKLMFVFYDFWVQGTSDPKIGSMMQKMYERWRQDIQGVLQEGVSQGEFRAEQADLVPTLMVSLMEGAALQSLIDPQALDLEAYFSAAEELIFNLIQ